MALMEASNRPDVPQQSRKPASALPAPVVKAIEKLGEDLNRARRRRNVTQQSLADRIGASLNTVKRMEAGDPRVPLHFLARALHFFGELQKLGNLLDSSEDDIGLVLADEHLPQRVRNRAKPRRSF